MIPGKAAAPILRDSGEKPRGNAMSLNLAEKQAVVAEVAKVAASAHSAIAAEYRGLSVAQLTTLRVKARETGVYLRVVKNTLARRAVRGTEFECLQPNLVGPLILAFSQEEPGAAARIFKEFLKEKTNDKLVVKTLGGRWTGFSSQRIGSPGQPADPRRGDQPVHGLPAGAARQVRADSQ
jgi:hypothetical protein